MNCIECNAEIEQAKLFRWHRFKVGLLEVTLCDKCMKSPLSGLVDKVDRLDGLLFEIAKANGQITVLPDGSVS